MQTRNPFLDDLTKVANSAVGALSGDAQILQMLVQEESGLELTQVILIDD